MPKPIVENQKIINTLENNFMPYAMSVIISRAIPEIDGFKPSHRKLLYTMHKMGLLSGAKTKSANVVGQTMKLNPHGDMAIYETLVRLTTGNEALLHPLIESKGNFGKQYSRDMAYAASRYTEVKLSGICGEVFADIEKDTVDFIDNYDGTMKEPTLLPTTFPNVLINPNQGIAVGMASNICSFNLREVCNAAKAVLKDENADISKHITAPDFSTFGELIYNEREMKEIFETGRGTFKVRGSYKYDKQNNCIDIISIPYTTSVEAVIDKVVDTIKQGKIKEISDIRDETDLNGLKITIDLKRGVDADALMARLYKMTPLQDTFGCNFNILVEGSPMVMGVKDILLEWIRFRMSCLRRSISFDLAKKKDKLHLLTGLEKILLDIDKAIRIVRETEEDELVVPNLMDGFGIDELQAEFVADIRLRNLNKEYILKRTAEISELMSDIERLTDILADNMKLKGIIAEQLTVISKKYGQERRTVLVHEHTVPVVEEVIEDYPITLFRTRGNYLKKISQVSLRTSGEQKVKEDDEVVQVIEANNRSEILMFGSLGNVYKMYAYDITDTKASMLGDYMPNLCGMEEGEGIVYVVATVDFKGYMLFCFENGKIAKIELSAYATKQNRRKMVGAYSMASKLSSVLYIREDMDIAVYSSIGKLLVVDTGNIAAKTTRTSQGINVLTAKRGSYLSDVRVLEDVKLADAKYYKTKNIPAVGCFIRDTDKGIEQVEI